MSQIDDLSWLSDFTTMKWQDFPVPETEFRVYKVGWKNYDLLPALIPKRILCSIVSDTDGPKSGPSIDWDNL